MLRVPAVATYRLFRDSDITTEVVWYQALPGAKVLPFGSMVLSPYQDPTGIVFPPGGYVQFTPVEYENVRPKPLAAGTHICGTAEDFREGGKYLPFDPPVIYRTDGLPTCCGAGVVGRGGGAAGGRSVVTLTPGFNGTTCPLSYVLASGVPHTFVQAAGVQRFLRIDGVNPGQTVDIVVSTDAGFVSCLSFHGTCALPVIGLSGNATSGSPVHFNFVRAAATGPEWITGSNALFQPTANVTYTVTVT